MRFNSFPYREWFYYKTPNVHQITNWTLFVKLFNQELWIVSVLTFILTGALSYTSAQNLWSSFGDSLFRTIEIFCRQGNFQIPSKLYAKIIFVIMLKISLVLSTMYSANLTSSLSVKKFKPPFHDIQSLLYDTNYVVGSVPGTAIRDVFVAEVKEYDLKVLLVNYDSFFPFIEY